MMPREKFRANKSLTKGYNDVIHSFQMQSALDAAALEYDKKMPVNTDLHNAAANRWRKEGADAYRTILENLNADSVNSRPVPASQLTHD